MFACLRRSLAAALLPCLTLLPCPTAFAGTPMNEPPAEDPPVLRMAAPEPEPTIAPEQEPVEIELPAPTVAPTPSPTQSFEPTVRLIDGKRPMPGSGLIVFGSMSMAVSSIMLLTAIAGPGWMDINRHDAALFGGASLPFALAGGLMVIGGSKSARRYKNWTATNQLSPPESGNGLMVAGSMLTLTFVGAAAYGAYWAHDKPIHERGDWAPAIASGALAGLGLAVLSAGMLRHSKFIRWERSAYLTPGPLALRRGAGLALTGRF